MATPRNRSVLKAFAMLRAFDRPDEWLTSSEVSRRANLPEASGYRLIQTLEEIGAVVRGPRGRYRPGMLLVSLSHNVAIGELLREASHGITSVLADRLNLTVHLGLLESGMVSYVAKVAPPSAFPIHTRVGSQLEAYSSGLGKILLAALPPGQLESFILDGDLVALTPWTITDRAVLRTVLDQVRVQGYALDDRESQNDMRCVAVPVRDSEGRVMAAMSASDSARAMTQARQEEVRLALLEAAAAIGRKVYPGAARRADAAPLPIARAS